MAVAVTRTDYLPRVPPKSRTELVRLAPDRKRVAFVRTVGWVAAVCISEAIERDPADEEEPWQGDLDEDTLTGASKADSHVMELAHPDGGPIVDLQWSPDGAFLAYRLAGAPPGIDDEIAWARSDAPGEVGRTPGTAFSWAPQRPVLYVADPAAYRLRRVAADSSQIQDLAEFIHYRNPRFWPHVVACPDGQRIAYTTRDERDGTTRVWLVQPRDGKPDTSLVTWIPGVDLHAYPVWSTQGVSLALHVVHEEQRRTGLIVLKQLRGHGRIWYEHDALDGPTAPAWAPDGRSFALFRQTDSSGQLGAAGLATDASAATADPYDPRTIPTGAPGQLLSDHALVRVDLATGQLDELAPAAALRGSLRYLDDERLLIDGGGAAHVLRLEQVADDD